jgi:hypothetical protein
VSVLTSCRSGCLFLSIFFPQDGGKSHTNVTSTSAWSAANDTDADGNNNTGHETDDTEDTIYEDSDDSLSDSEQRHSSSCPNGSTAFANSTSMLGPLPPPGPPAPDATTLVGHRGRYQILKMLGGGAFATVFEGRDTASGKSVAVKQIQTLLEHASTGDTSEYTWGMSFGNHPNIVKTFESVYKGGREHLILELASGGDMYDCLNCTENAHQRIAFTTVRKYVLEMAQAIQYLHSDHGIVHADIKLENFLLHNGTVKLCDFGMVGPIGKVRHGTPAGSTPYMAPELFRTTALGQLKKQPNNLPSFHNNGYVLTPAMDAWSFGVVLYVVLFCGLPWEKASKGESRFDSFVSRGGVQAANWPFSLLSPGMVGILGAALHLNPNHRGDVDDFIAFFADDQQAWFEADGIGGKHSAGAKEWRIPLLAVAQ